MIRQPILIEDNTGFFQGLPKLNKKIRKNVARFMESPKAKLNRKLTELNRQMQTNEQHTQEKIQELRVELEEQ